LAVSLSERKGTRATDTSAYEQAAIKAEQAVALDPKCSEAWSLLAYLRYRIGYDVCGRGDYSLAIQAAKNALSMEAPSKVRAAAMRNMARIAAAQLRWEDAERLLTESLSLDRGNREARSWLDDLAIRKAPRPEFLSAIRKVLDGELLAGEDVDMLSAAEITSLLNAPLARNGRRLNAGPSDWLFYCDGSPVGQHPEVEPTATRNPIRKGTPDFENTQLLVAMRRQVHWEAPSGE